MTNTHEVRTVLRWVIMSRLLDRLPEGTFIDVNRDLIDFQAYTQAAVRGIRVAFGGGLVWQKVYSPNTKWWEYSTTLANGFGVRIYACYEAPATCKAIEEQVKVIENVPIAWEEREVTKTVVRWDCSGDDAGAA